VLPAANRSILTRHKPGALPTITQVYVGVDRPPGGQWPGDELEKRDLVRPSVRLVPRSECCTDPRFVRLTHTLPRILGHYVAANLNRYTSGEKFRFAVRHHADDRFDSMKLFIM